MREGIFVRQIVSKYCIFCFATLVSLFCFYYGTSYAMRDAMVDPNKVIPVVSPLLKPQNSPDTIQWDYRGYLNSELKDPYFNRYLPALIDSTTGEKSNKYLAAVGCVNLAMGQIMYMYGYPDKNSPEIDTNTSFTVWNDFIPIPGRKIQGGTEINRSYKWEIMKPRPTYEVVPDRFHFPKNPGRDEAGKLLRDISVAMNSTYYLKYSPELNKPNAFDYPQTSTQAIRAPKVFKEYFHYKSANFLGFPRYTNLVGALGGNGVLFGSLSRKTIEENVIPSLELGMPVILDMSEWLGGQHEIIIDGYGYLKSISAPYDKIIFHLAMGEGSLNLDGWYDITSRGSAVLGQCLKINFTSCNYYCIILV
jgi:hypothetical protein